MCPLYAIHRRLRTHHCDRAAAVSSSEALPHCPLFRNRRLGGKTLVNEKHSYWELSVHKTRCSVISGHCGDRRSDAKPAEQSTRQPVKSPIKHLHEQATVEWESVSELGAHQGNTPSLVRTGRTRGRTSRRDGKTEGSTSLIITTRGPAIIAARAPCRVARCVSTR